MILKVNVLYVKSAHKGWDFRDDCTEFIPPEAEFEEFEPWLKFKPWLKYSWFHLKLYSIFKI